VTEHSAFVRSDPEQFKDRLNILWHAYTDLSGPSKISKKIATSGLGRKLIRGVGE